MLILCVTATSAAATAGATPVPAPAPVGTAAPVTSSPGSASSPVTPGPSVAPLLPDPSMSGPSSTPAVTTDPTVAPPPEPAASATPLTPAPTVRPLASAPPSASPAPQPEPAHAARPAVWALTLSAPMKGTTVVLQSAQRAPHDGLAITGRAIEALGKPAALAPVHLVGGPGVYFSLAAGTAADPLTAADNDDLSRTIAAGTDASGVVQRVYAYFTRAGLNTITATSGTASSTLRVIAANATDPYRVTVADLTGTPGSRMVVIGTVLDAFGNPVPDVGTASGTGSAGGGSAGSGSAGVAGQGIGLTTANPAFGQLASASAATDSSGMFSTAFTANATLNGRTTLVATLNGARATTSAATPSAGQAVEVNPVPDPAWLAAGGLSLASGAAQARARITLSGRVSFAAPESLIGRGKARLRGTAVPGTRVDIYAKPIGAAYSTKIGSAVANRDGNWGVGTTIDRTTSWRAVTRHRRSGILTTVVHLLGQPRRSVPDL